MDDITFDRIARTASAGWGRRSILGLLASTAFGRLASLSGLDESEARDKIKESSSMLRPLRLNGILISLNLVLALLFGAFITTAPAAAQGVEGACGDVGSVSHVTIVPGDAGPDVEHAQCLLNDNWGFNLAMDGQFGELTQAAVEEVQSINGLAIDGEIGPCTWAVLHVVDPPAGC